MHRLHTATRRHRLTQKFFTLSVLGLSILMGIAPNAIAQTSEATTRTDLEQRLEELASQFEQHRQDMHIPGMALAVVKDDEVVMSRGFGSADLANATAATAETIFAVGSTTKAFTASLVGMLIDEGKMDWDDPVTKYLPYFELDLDTEKDDAYVSIRDLLAHRTGFTRMGLLWAGNQASREEVLRTATKAKAWSEYQGDFFYNNVTFMAAGAAAEKASGSSWEELIAQRFFQPLGMNKSTTSVSQASHLPNLALGYTWKETSQSHDQPPMRALDAIAPAGSINSNVIDMSQWLRFQLNRGQVDGEQLLSEDQLEETWSQQIKVADGVDYGLGWMLREVDGHRVVEHGGNIDGFSAQVTLLPDANMGFVLLMNLSAAPLQSASTPIFVETMLGDRQAVVSDAADNSDGNLEQFTGKYIANFGPFKDTHFTVSLDDGVLAVDVPGQTNYALKAPDEDGKRYFVLTDQIAVSFDRNENDEVTGLKMYQGGMTFELPREGVELVAEIPLTELDKYLGDYTLEGVDKPFSVVVQNKRLALDIPGQTVAELHAPDAEGRWVFRMTDRIHVTFEQNPSGTIESLTLHEPDASRTMPRRVDSETRELPTVAEVMASRTFPPELTGRPMQLSGTVQQVHAGISGTFTAYFDGPLQRVDIDFGKFGWTRTIVTEERGRTESNLAPTEELEGKYLQQAQLDNPAGWFGDLQPLFDSMTVTGEETRDGTNVAVIRATAGELQPITLYIDTETGDVVQSDSAIIEQNLGITIPTTSKHSDFREVNGARIAFTSVTSNPWAGETLIKLSQVEFLDEIDQQLFKLDPAN